MKIDMNRVNDAEYMKEKIKEDSKNIDYLGEELLNNPEFVLESMRGIRYGVLYQRLGWELKQNPDFMLKYTVNTGNINYFVRKYIHGDDVIIEALKMAGIYNDLPGALEKIGRTTYERFDKRKQKALRENIENITSENILEWTRSKDRYNPELMLELITRDENIYLYLDPILKKDKEFMTEAMQKNPRIKDVIEQEEQRKQKEKEERRIKRNEERKQKEEEIRQKELEELVQQYNDAGETHPRLILVNDFLESNISKKIFCQMKDIDENELDKALEEVAIVYPEIEAKIKNRNKQATAIYLSTIEKINKKLLSGEISLIEYSRGNEQVKKVDELLRGTKSSEESYNL